MERSPTLLVADDDADQRELLSDLLGLEGFRVVAAGTPAEARDAVVAGVDVLLLDLHGALDDALERLLLDLGPDRPALVLASGDPDIHAHARRLRADGVLPKPFGLDELLAAVRTALQARGVPRSV